MSIKKNIAQLLTMKELFSYMKKVVKWKNNLGFLSIVILDKNNKSLNPLDFVNNQIPYSKIAKIKCCDKMGLIIAHRNISNISKITGYKSPFKIKDVFHITHKEIKENMNVFFDFKQDEN